MNARYGVITTSLATQRDQSQHHNQPRRLFDHTDITKITLSNLDTNGRSCYNVTRFVEVLGPGTPPDEQSIYLYTNIIPILVSYHITCS